MLDIQYIGHLSLLIVVRMWPTDTQGWRGAESSEICPGCVKLHQQARRGEKINTIERGRVTKRFRKQIK